MSSIERFNTSHRSLAITDSAATTAAVNKSGFTTGMIYVPAGSSITTLTFYVANHAANREEAGTYIQAYDDANAAISRTVAAGRAYRLPLELCAAAFLKIVGDVAGTIHLDLQG
jgi:hypothetical protein